MIQLLLHYSHLFLMISKLFRNNSRIASAIKIPKIFPALFPQAYLLVATLPSYKIVITYYCTISAYTYIVIHSYLILRFVCLFVSLLVVTQPKSSHKQQNTAYQLTAE